MKTFAKLPREFRRKKQVTVNVINLRRLYGRSTKVQMCLGKEE